MKMQDSAPKKAPSVYVATTVPWILELCSFVDPLV
jgi:hypothetical protein